MTHHAQRIGAVAYLNTDPLVYQWERFATNCQLELDVPSRLAERLAAGSLDVALIPTAAYFRGADYQLVSDACIACRGPVRSVKLLSRVPMSAIRTLAVDEGSATSVVLAQVLLERRHGIRPALSLFPLGQALSDTATDAVVMIGDRAMGPAPLEFPSVWDLGDEWCRWAELPFVFAVWAARGGTQVATLETALAAIRDHGLAHLADVAAQGATRRGLAVSDCYRYLANHLHFQLGPRERAGMALFYREAARLGLVPPGQEDRLAHDCEIAR